MVTLERADDVTSLRKATHFDLLARLDRTRVAVTFVVVVGGDGCFLSEEFELSTTFSEEGVSVPTFEPKQKSVKTRYYSNCYNMKHKNGN